MQASVIAGYVRSPFTPAKRGALAAVRPDDLAASVVRALVARIGVDADDIEDLFLGCAFPEGEQGGNMARLVALQADLPVRVGGVTVNRYCGSSMHAVHLAAGQIALGAGDVFVCAGVESMSRVPIGGFNPLPNPALHAKHPGLSAGMGETAETVARRWAITRAAQDALALCSHRRAAAAQATGRFRDEIVPIVTADGTVNADGCLRADATMDGLAALRPAFDQNGSVTAGTSAPLTDGAAALLVCSEDYARRRGLEPLARVVSVAVAGCAPDVMGMGPVPATRKALSRAGLALDRMDVVELNEAFAAQVLACIAELGLREDTFNLHGGALALGHPLGATGARILGKAASLLKEGGGRYALATQCIGGGQGIATILESL